jgi:long-chain fatty acid transport protein
MKKIATTLGAFALTATAAQAGGIDRSGQSVGILFETGNYAEFSFGRVRPNVSGVGAATPPAPFPPQLSPTPGQASGDMAGDYNAVMGGLKYQFNDRLSAALIVDQPFGADVDYAAGTTYFASGANARIRTMATTALLKYTTPNNLSVYGGLKYQTMSAVANVPFIGGYTGMAAKDGGAGYVLGVAYERPEIALRVALTYSSKVKHDFLPVETTQAPLPPALFGVPTRVETPQSVNLDFQTGVAEGTLLFGSIRWVDWSNFKIDPSIYNALTSGGDLVSYAKDTTLYTLGIGRRINENWAVSAAVGYEKASGGFQANLGPTDGRKSLTLGAIYTRDNMKISGGVSYVRLGDTQTTLGAGVPASNFSDNKAIGIGIRIGYNF